VWGKKMLYGRVYDGIVRTTFIIRDGIIVRVIVDVDKEHHGKQVAEA
jgi:peroxiredoxin